MIEMATEAELIAELKRRGWSYREVVVPTGLERGVGEDIRVKQIEHKERKPTKVTT